MNTSIEIDHVKVWNLLKIYLIDRYVLGEPLGKGEVRIHEEYKINESAHNGCIAVSWSSSGEFEIGGRWTTPDSLDGPPKCSEEWRAFYLESGCQDFIDKIVMESSYFTVGLSMEDRNRLKTDIDATVAMISDLERI